MIPCLRKNHGSRTTAKSEIEDIIKTFCTDLYKSSNPPIENKNTPTTEPPFLVSEIRHAIVCLQNSKLPGKNGITA